MIQVIGVLFNCDSLILIDISFRYRYMAKGLGEILSRCLVENGIYLIRVSILDRIY